MRTVMSSFFAQFKEEFKFELKKKLDPIIQIISKLEVEIQNKCSMHDLKHVVIETAKQELQNLSENIFDITIKLEACAAPLSKSSQNLSEIIQNRGI